MFWLVHHVQLSNINNNHAACWNNSLHSTSGRSFPFYEVSRGSHSIINWNQKLSILLEHTFPDMCCAQLKSTLRGCSSRRWHIALLIVTLRLVCIHCMRRLHQCLKKSSWLATPKTSNDDYCSVKLTEHIASLKKYVSKYFYALLEISEVWHW